MRRSTDQFDGEGSSGFEALKLGIDGAEIRLRLALGEARFQPAKEHDFRGTAADLRGPDFQRNPEVDGDGRKEAGVAWGRDTDDRVGLCLRANALAEDGGVGVEEAAPGVVAEDGDGYVLGVKPLAEVSLETEDFGVVLRYGLGGDDKWGQARISFSWKPGSRVA